MVSTSTVQRVFLRSRRPALWPARGNIPSARGVSNVSVYEAKVDGRARLSRLWLPTGGIAATSNEDSHAKLLRAGFLRQAHPGIFHMLPLGRRVQDKLEALIDKHMFQLGASKLAMSSISSEELWAKSGRLANANSELFHFSDRKEAKYLLSPTHEEEITTLVSGTVKSYKELPVRLYQTSRKYRDELRPRHGLLRSREFIMKDLYTFDYSSPRALETYHEVRRVYARLFDELKLPYMVAEADSGDMGGNLSHEFHFPTSRGEDHIISCSRCDYVANEELAESPVPEKHQQKNVEPEASLADVLVWRGISRDKLTLINVWYQSPPNTADSSAKGHEINMHAVKAILPEFDPSIDDPLSIWMKLKESVSSPEGTLPRPRKLVNLVDSRLPLSTQQVIGSQNSPLPIVPEGMQDLLQDLEMHFMDRDPSTQCHLNLLRIRDGDSCPRCSDGSLKVQKAIELGHTFHLGTRYSEPLSATVATPVEIESGGSSPGSSSSQQIVTEQRPMQMGCHGIGVSRIIGAVADTLADDKGLNWPRVMAPFEVLVVPSKGNEEASISVHDILQGRSSANGAPIDLALDDRMQTFSWKMHDADLVGYPVVIVVGRRWKKEQICEIQCRRLGAREDVHIDEMAVHVESLLSQL